MSKKKLDEAQQLENVLDALAHSIEHDSDEEILEDERLAGSSPAETLTSVQQTLAEALAEHQAEQRQRLRSHYEAEVSTQKPSRSRSFGSLAEKVAFLTQVFTQQPQLQGMLTAQHRDFDNLTEQDVDSYLDDLAALRLLDEPDSRPDSDE